LFLQPVKALGVPVGRFFKLLDLLVVDVKCIRKPNQDVDSGDVVAERCLRGR
jgi:hypothetical protein